jgi:predicted aspartyl protease
VRLIALALTLACASPVGAHQADAQGRDPQAVRESQQIALTRTRLGHYTITLRLDRPVLLGPEAAAHDEIRLVVDTAASHTALNLPIAEQLNIGDPFVLDLLAHGTTGSFLTDTLVLQDADFGAGLRDIDSIVLPGPEETAYGSHGFLGASAFNDERIEIDFPRGRLTIDRNMPIARHLEIDPDRRIVTGFARVRGVPQPVRVLIDTGSNASIANTALAGRRSGLSPGGQTRTLVNGVDTQASMRSERRRLFGGLEIGQLCFPMFWASVLDVYAFENLGWSDEPAMIIGLDILADARLRIDYHSGAVEVEGLSDTDCRRTNTFRGAGG